MTARDQCDQFCYAEIIMCRTSRVPAIHAPSRSLPGTRLVQIR